MKNTTNKLTVLGVRYRNSLLCSLDYNSSKRNFTLFSKRRHLFFGLVMRYETFIAEIRKIIKAFYSKPSVLDFNSYLIQKKKEKELEKEIYKENEKEKKILIQNIHMSP